MKGRRSVVQKSEYELVETIKEEERHSIFLVQKAGRRFLMKIGDVRASHIAKEVEVNLYIRAVTDLNVPFSQFLHFPGFPVAVHEYIEGDAFASDAAKKLNIEPSDEELRILVEALRKFDSLDIQEVPRIIRDEASQFGHDYYVGRFESMRDAAIENGIERTDFDALFAFFANSQPSFAFQHHDFVLWNMMLSEDKKLYLLDPEFSRWGLRWYDAAYFYVQAATYLDAENVGMQLLEMLFENGIPDELYIPLSYRIVVNVSELNEDAFLRERTLNLFQRVLKRSL